MKQSLSSKLCIYFILITGAVIALFPFYWMLISSFKYRGDIFVFPPQFIPASLTHENYITLFKETGFLRSLYNSFFVGISYTVLSVFLCSLAGYVFAKHRFPFQKFLFAVVIGTMTLPLEITIVPLFITMTKLHWVNSFAAVIIPFSASAWSVFLMRQVMLVIPDEMIDAARIDGAGEFKLFSRIIVPVSIPSLGALATLQFLSSWKDYMWPLIVLTENKKMTVPVILGLFKSGVFADYAGMTAASILASLPIILAFFFLQKTFIRSAMFSSVKG